MYVAVLTITSTHTHTHTHTVAVVSLDPTDYLVMENMSTVSVCAVLQGEAEFRITASLRTEDGTARGKQTPYSAIVCLTKYGMSHQIWYVSPNMVAHTVCMEDWNKLVRFNTELQLFSIQYNCTCRLFCPACIVMFESASS